VIDRICAILALSRRELGILAALFLVSLPAVTPRIYSSDEIEYFSYLRSLWFDHDVSFENEYRYFYERDVARAEGFHETFLERETEAGRRPNFGTIGCALLWTPFYAAGDLVARSGGGSHGIAADGFSYPYIAAVAYGSAFYGFVAVLLSIGCARHVLRLSRARDRSAGIDRASLMAGNVVCLGTPLVFYMYVAPPMSHACSAFAVALFVTIWLHVRATWTTPQVVILGLAAALMAMVREQDLFFAVGPAVDWAIAAAGRLRGTRLNERARVPLAAGVVGAIAFAIGVTPQLIAYSALNGHPGPSSYVTRKMDWGAPYAVDVLLSPSHGFFFWTPVAVIAVAGLAWFAIRDHGEARRVGAIALLMVALQVYVAGSVQSWNVAGAFGQRRFVALTVLLTIGLAVVFHQVTRSGARAAVIFVSAMCVWWNLALIAEFGTGLMDRQRLELGRNAYDAFITVPRLAPQLAYRYVVDRESYYRTRMKRNVE
jgi:hypothetical protein